MPTFEFTGGGFTSTSGNSNVALSFNDTSSGSTVNFTLSSTGNTGLGQVGIFSAGGTGSTGQVSISDGSAGGTLTLDVADGTAGPIDFGGTGTANSISLDLGNSVSGTWNIVFEHATNATLNQTFTVTNNAQMVNFTANGTYDNIQFTMTSGFGFLTVDSITASITCYLTGTGIATPKGRVAVETLQPGDEVLTADGGTTTVRWLGIQPIDTRTATPSKANPICFVAGALGPNVPSRDLFVSPDHAMEIDGLLYNASALVNGRSIYQVAQMPMDGFTYYHVDTGAHELILAEDAASETYLDAVGRDAFINGHEQADAPIIAEMSVPRIVAKRMVPQDVAQDLSHRADALGLSVGQKVA